MDKRRMCPNCRAFVTTSDKVCPYCEVPLGPRAIDRRSISDGLIPTARFVTTIILLLNIGLYIATAIYSMRHGDSSPMDLDARTLVWFGGKFRPALLEGQWWRLITAGFLHGGIFHILMNSWVLMDLGAQVEENFGARRMIVIYVLATMGGFAASTFWSPAVSVGASAGIFGLLGAMIALGTRYRGTMASALRPLYLRWAIYGLLIGLLPFFRVDNAAHVGGLIAGFVVAYAAGTPRLAADWREKLWTLLMVACLGLTAVAFLRMFLWFSLASRLG